MPIEFDYNDMDVNLNELDDLEEYVSEGDVDVDKVFDEGDTEDNFVGRQFDKVVVVDNIPKGVSGEKIGKLEAKLLKVFQQCGTIQQDGMTIPLNDEGATRGFAFVAYSSADEAQQAIRLVNGFKFTKTIVFKVFPYHDLEKFKTWPEEYQQPTIPEFKQPLDTKSWLLDTRDQYSIRHGSNTEIYWCDGVVLDGKGSLVYDGAREREAGKTWCEMYTAWSPTGSYFVTFHKPGVAIWGGSDFSRKRRFEHKMVQHILFSPNEKYLMTWNGNDDNKDGRALIVWDIRTGKELRSFKVSKQLNGEPAEWPVMKWSPDDKYFARQIENGISVYEAKTMKLLEKKPVITKGIQHFEWSNSDSIIAYWAPEHGNLPARVVLLDPVKRQELRSKNLFNVRQVRLHWQDAGDFLCAQVLRHTKSGKTTFTNLEIFRMRDSNIPNEMVEIKDMVEHFSWEPKKHRFGIIHGENQHKMGISFYSCGSIKKGSSIEKMYTVPNKSATKLHWSPAGNAVIFAGTAINGNLEFWDVDENVCTAEEEHFMCNEIQWDPSGRIVATIVTQPLFGSVTMRYQLENGFNLWTFQGKLLRKEQIESFYQFQWRPRPKTLLSEKEVQNIVKHLTSYITKYSKSDEHLRKLMDHAKNKDKIEQLTSFRELLKLRSEQAQRIEEERKRLSLSPEQDESEFDTMDEIEEVVLSEKVTPLN